MEFTITQSDLGNANITLLLDGVPYEADSTHPWWEEIVDLALENDPRVVDLFPIRPIQQPSEEVPTSSVPDEKAAAQALVALFGDRDFAEADLSGYDLAQIRRIFDEAGFGTCDDPLCIYCQGDRA